MHGLREHTDQSVGDGGRVRDVVTGHHDDELVATHATGDRAGVETAQQSVGDDADEPVTTAVAERIVDRLEPVEVAEQQADRPRLVGTGEHLIQHLEGAASVVQTGERIVRGLMGEPLVDCRQLVVHAGQLAALVREIAQQPLRCATATGSRRARCG